MDCDMAEVVVHEKLSPFRPSSNREFFEVSLHESIKIVDDVAIQQLEERIAITKNHRNHVDKDVLNNWHNFLLSLGWRFKRIPEFEYKRGITPEFIIDIYRDCGNFEGDNPNNVILTEVKMSVFICSDIDPNKTQEISENEFVQNLRDKLGDWSENAVTVVGNSPMVAIGGLFFGWTFVGYKWELLRFTCFPFQNEWKNTYGLLNDNSTWKCIIYGKHIEKENVYFDESEVRELWTKVISYKKPVCE